VLYPYHLAPLVGVIFAIVTQGLRHLYVMVPRSRRVGLLLVLPICVGLAVAMKANADDLVITLPYWDRTAEWHRDARASIAEWLNRRPGKQLVVVRYGRFHEVNQEWVHNAADIDGSKIVWAREVDPRSDAELLSYFRDREAWLLEADVMPVRVVKYPRPAAVVEKLPEISRK